MGATVFSLGAVRIVQYCLSGFPVLPTIFQINGQNWLVITLCISNWVNCMSPPCVRICDQTDSTVKPRFTNAWDHEQFGLGTNFLNTKRLG